MLHKQTLLLLATASLMLATASLMLAAGRFPFHGVWRFPSPSPDNQSFIQDGFYHCPLCSPAVRIPADGKDHAVPNQYIEGGTMSVTIVNDRETLRVGKQGSKELYRVHSKVSPDGKSLDREITDHTSGEPKVDRRHGERAGKPKRGHLVNGPWQFPGPSITYEESADGMILTEAGGGYRAKFDGKPHRQAPLAGKEQTVVIRRIHSRRIEEQVFLDGKLVGRAVVTVSRDGQTLTNDVRSIDGKRTKKVARRVGDPPAQN